MSIPGFRIPAITSITKKVQQIISLRALRNLENKTMHHCWNKNIRCWISSNPLNIAERNYSLESYTSETKSVMLHQGYYQSETKMQRYKGPHQPSQVSTPVENWIHPTTKVDYTFDVEDNHLCKYPVNFKGFYCCGYKYHYRTKYWSISRSITFDNQEFFKELWAQKSRD